MIEYILTFIFGGVVTTLLVSVFGIGILTQSKQRVDTNTSNNSNQIPKVEGNKSSNVIHDNNENIQKSDTSLIEHTKNDNMTNGIKSPIKHVTSYTCAEIITVVNKHNVCVAIFKNPCDQKTHFYKYRYRVKKKPEGVQNTEEDCPVELRNIAAAIRLWGKLWSNISNVKICQSSCSALEEESKWLTRLEGQQEDCQNKYGCRVSFVDAEFISKQDQSNFNQLSKRIMDSYITEDDLIYFNGKDDSNDVDKTYFDL